MGRRKDNPDLVDELIDGLWTMNQSEFEYNSLSSNDMNIVSAAINRMQKKMEYNDMVNTLW